MILVQNPFKKKDREKAEGKEKRRNRRENEREGEKNTKEVCRMYDYSSRQWHVNFTSCSYHRDPLHVPWNVDAERTEVEFKREKEKKMEEVEKENEDEVEDEE